jgi:hypothetical protein
LSFSGCFWGGDDGDGGLNGERAVVSTLVGGVSGTNGAYADGNGTSAGFNAPVSVSVDASGNVFVTDYYNQRIRKVMAGGGTRIGPITLRACLADIQARAHACGGHWSLNSLFPSSTLISCIHFRLSSRLPRQLCCVS